MQMLPEAKEVAASACEADPSECESRQATQLLRDRQTGKVATL
jgi:hypothetical protein